MKIIVFLMVLAEIIFAYVGTVSALRGEAFVIRDNKKIKLVNGMKIDNHDIIKTTNALLQIVFKDRTIITIGKNSSFNIQNYLFDDNKKPIANFRLNKGIIKTITGKIGKIAPNRFKIHTANAVIGIRGTIFFVEADKDITKVSMLEGVTSFLDIHSSKTFNVKTGEQIILEHNKIQINKNFTIPTFTQLALSKNFKVSISQISNQLTNTINALTKIKAFNDLKEKAIDILPVLTYETKTPVNNAYYTLSYQTNGINIINNQVTSTLDTTPDTEISNLIMTNASASYSGDLLASSDTQAWLGDVNLNFNFGSGNWNGNFNAGDWKFTANGMLNSSTFTSTSITTDATSVAKNITGVIIGNVVGEQADAIIGEGMLSSDKGNINISFGATKQ